MKHPFTRPLRSVPFLVCLLIVVPAWSGAMAQPEEKQRKTIPMPADLPALYEVDALHKPGDVIRRYFLTSQGMRGQTVALEDTGGWFCTLSQDTNVMLDYWPNREHWVFQVGFNEEAELAAGGLATCHQLQTLAEGE